MAEPVVIHDYVRLSAWDFETPATYYDGKVYFSLRILCDFLGVKAQMQLQRLRDDDVFSRFLRQVPLKTRTGVRDTWCIEKRGIGWWIASIQRQSVKPEVRSEIITFQEALIDEADRRFFSESERKPLAALRAQLLTLESKYANQERYVQMLEGRIARLEEGSAR